MRKLISTCIVLAILRITCQYAETVGVYQTEVVKGEMISVQNDVWIEAIAIAVQSDWSGVRRLIKMSNNRREYGKAIDIYYPLLAEYERAWKDKDYYDEYEVIMSDYRFRSLSNSFGYKELCFALADLADDGSVELVIGVKSDGKYIICTIYSYDGDSIYCADTGVDGDRTLYETGIYEVSIGMRGVAIFDYYQFKEDLQQAEFVIGLTQSYEDEKYYKYMEPENSDNIEITEEEFREIREQYEKNPIELDWQELEGYALNLVPQIDEYYSEEEMEGIEKTGDAVLAEKEKDLREHVVVIKEKSYQNDIPKYEKEYDEAGNMIKEVSYIDYSVGSISWHEYEYDEMGNEIKFVCRYDNGDIAWYHESEYDESGNRIKLSYYDGNGSIEHEYKYEHDEMGNVTMMIGYNEDGSMLEQIKVEYEYDEMENMTKRAYYKGEYAMLFWDEYEYEYSECGSVSRKKEFHYYSSDDIPSWDEYEYDEAGNEIRFTRGKGENRIETWSEYEYDMMGNKVKETTYHSDGSIESWDEYEYNAAGCKIKETSYHADGSIPYVGCFEYDEMGNRIKYTHLEGKAEYGLKIKYVMKYEYEYAYAD